VTPIRVVLAEDQPMVRSGFRALLDSRSDIEVVGEAATGVEAVEQVRAQRPGVAVMDIRMPEMDGLEATRHITADQTLSDTRVLVLTTFELDEYVYGALRAGASGFLLKGGQPDDLVQAIRVVAGGESLLAPSVTRRLIQACISRPEPAARSEPEAMAELTPREREVLGLVATMRVSDGIEPATAGTTTPRRSLGAARRCGWGSGEPFQIRPRRSVPNSTSDM
jgi:DNA-binding NarL/FixJ family response regulator